MNILKQNNSRTIKGHKGKAKTLINTMAAGILALTMTSCNPFDKKGEFVNRGDITDVTTIPNPRAVNFLKNLRGVANMTDSEGGELELQSFNQLYDYVEDETRNIGENFRVEIRKQPNIQIDPRVSAPNSNPYMDWSARAQEGKEKNRQIALSWSSNFTQNGQRLAGKLELTNYGGDDKVYLGANEVDKEGILSAIDRSLPY